MPLASRRRWARACDADRRSVADRPRNLASSSTRSSCRGAAGGLRRVAGTSAFLRVASERIVRLLRDGCAVCGVKPQFAGIQQLMEIAKRRQRGLRRTNLDAGAIHRVELPGRQDRHRARYQLDMHELTRCPSLTLDATRTAPVQRMPTIMDNYILPDMGRMDARLRSADEIGSSAARTRAAIARLLPTR